MGEPTPKVTYYDSIHTKFLSDSILEMKDTLVVAGRVLKQRGCHYKRAYLFPTVAVISYRMQNNTTGTSHGSGDQKPKASFPEPSQDAGGAAFLSEALGENLLRPFPASGGCCGPCAARDPALHPSSLSYPSSPLLLPPFAVLPFSHKSSSAHIQSPPR